MKISCIWFLIPIIAACSNVKLDNFDAKKWKEDRKGCLGLRQKELKSLWEQRDKLKRMDDDNFVELLGKPEETDYYKQGKKLYSYYIYPGKQCNDTIKTKSQRLTAEFDGLGYLKILTIQD